MPEADILIETKRRRRLLIGVCRLMTEPTLERVIDQRDMLTPIWTTDHDYFLLVLHGDLYLWKQQAPEGSPPEHTGPASSIWSRYMQWSPLIKNPPPDSNWLTYRRMKRAAYDWLDDLASNITAPDPNCESDQFLLRAGLYHEMKNGFVHENAEA